MEVENNHNWESSGKYMNDTNMALIKSQTHTHEGSSEWLFSFTTMLSTQQELGAVSSNAQQRCNSLFLIISHVIMIECGGIVARLSKRPEMLELQQDSCTIATFLPLIHHKALKNEVRPLELLVVEIEGK
jgi:hypothetical protein